LSSLDVSRLTVALTLLVVGAHTMGYLFARLRQPPVIGEILAGLLLGPTVLGLAAPGVQEWIFPRSGATAGFLAAVSEIGLLLLMYLTGTELRLHTDVRERRVVAAVSAGGLVLPFVCGVAVAAALDPADFSGENGSAATFAMVFAIAIAVTSIPVISRIMLDLGMLRTGFARVVLTVAVIEDILLYGILAVVLSLGQAGSSDEFGLWGLFDVDSTPLSVAYHLSVTLVFFAVALPLGARLADRLLHSPLNVVERRSPVAFRLIFLLAAALCCVVLGINPIFGALIAGLATARGAGRGAGRHAGPGDALRQFALAFFVPTYFAVVGLKLDLVRNFDPVFFVWFLAVACVVKASSVWGAARLCRWPAAAATDLAVALNARGGPGIVLASVTMAAGIINESFFTALVLLSVLTSQFAGVWLDRRFGAVAGGAGIARDRTGDRASARYSPDRS
jgi:Kef-type K+ transport system membrane component KefB